MEVAVGVDASVRDYSEMLTREVKIFEASRCFQESIAKLEVAFYPGTPSAELWAKIARQLTNDDLLERRDGLSPRLRAELELEKYLKEVGEWREVGEW